MNWKYGPITTVALILWSTSSLAVVIRLALAVYNSKRGDTGSKPKWLDWMFWLFLISGITLVLGIAYQL